MSLREALATRIVEAGERIRVRSALNPILWLCAIVGAPATIAAAAKDRAPDWLITMAFLPVGVACLGFLILLFRDPDKLQSEDFQLQKRSMDILQEKGQPIRMVSYLNDMIENPNPPRIENDRTEADE